MKTKLTKKHTGLLLFIAIFVGIGTYLLINSFAATVPACTSTVSTGANLASAVSGAAANSVICLNDGNYGSVNFFDISRTSFVIVRSTNGTAATISPQVGNSDYIKFQSLTINSSLVNSCSTHIHFLNSTFTGGLLITNNGGNCGTGNQDYLIDSSTFNNVGQATYEGRLSVVQAIGAVISNSTFSGIGSQPSDGVQLLGNTTNSTIGPGNKFTGIQESLCGSVHCDAVQLYGAGANNTIIGNYFEKGDTFIMAPDDSTTTTVTNNVFDGTGSSYDGKIQFGGAASPVFKHNTLRNLTAHFTAKVLSCGSSGVANTGTHTTNAQVMNNIFDANSGINTLISDCSPRPSACDSCTFSNNMFASSGSATGTNNLIGIPVYSGGTSPNTYSGFALANGSPGKSSASDGKDMGIDAGSVGTNGCDLNVTTANLSAQVTAATTGQTLCLATGDYGTWQGTNKAITLKAAANATPTMKFNFGSGDTGFTLDGMSNMGGTVVDGASKITIKNSNFTSTLDMDGSSIRGMVIDGNKFDWQVGPTFGGGNAKIFAGADGAFPGDGAIITNNTFRNGDLDGIHGGSGLLVTNNIFDNLCDFNMTQNGQDSNHTDNIQFEGGHQTRIAGNYFHASSSCPTQGITSFDSGTVGIIIENNVVDIHRPWGIEFYSDQNSIIRHNTVVYHPDADCDFTGQPCGQIDINRKSADPAGSGTHVYDNITTDVGFNSGSTGTADHNISGINALFTGGTTPTTYAGYALAAGSPGKNAASDGKDIGVDLSVTPAPPVKVGDTNNDGLVNIIDLSTLLSKWNTNFSAADFNKDSSVNIFDLSILLSNYGK